MMSETVKPTVVGPRCFFAFWLPRIKLVRDIPSLRERIDKDNEENDIEF